MGKQHRSGLRLALSRRVWCTDHSKHLYATRGDAKAVLRDHHSDPNMREYKCATLDGWHVGHMPDAVKQGEITTREIYG
jgi:hypothetical protein